MTLRNVCVCVCETCVHFDGHLQGAMCVIMVYRQAVTIVTTTVLVLAVSGSDKDMQPEPNSNLYIFELDHQVPLDDSQPVNSQLFHLV